MMQVSEVDESMRWFALRQLQLADPESVSLDPKGICGHRKRNSIQPESHEPPAGDPADFHCETKVGMTVVSGNFGWLTTSNSAD